MNRPAIDRIQLLQAPLVGETAKLLANAMDADAAYRYLFPSPDERSRGLRRLFEGNLALHVGHNCTYVGMVGDRVAATVTLRPLAGLAISSWTMLRYGLAPFLMAHGFGAVRRMLWLKHHYDGLEAQLSAGRPHFHVHMVAVLPEWQGRGFGREVLAHVLDSSGTAGTDHPVVLTTHLERNGAFYRRAGFELCWERVVSPPGGDSYAVWGMKKG